MYYNLRTQVDWHFIPFDASNKTIFVWVFWSFDPTIEGFKYCRPLIQIDRTHLYTGKYKGILLTSLTIDSNRHIFSIAFDIIEAESIPSWSWFLSLKQDGKYLVSDRNRDILSIVINEEINWTEPRAYHHYYLFHVTSNFNTNQSNWKFWYRRLQSKIPMTQVHQMHEIVKANEPWVSWIFLWYRFRKICKITWQWVPLWVWMTTNALECMNEVLKRVRMLLITCKPSPFLLLLLRVMGKFIGWIKLGNLRLR